MKYENINQLSIGMKVKVSDLDNILDTYIILDNLKIIPDKTYGVTYEGTIEAISKEPIRRKKETQTIVFNNSDEIEGWCYYD